MGGRRPISGMKVLLSLPIEPVVSVARVWVGVIAAEVITRPGILHTNKILLVVN